jgi:hypothetical protein
MATDIALHWESYPIGKSSAIVYWTGGNRRFRSDYGYCHILHLMVNLAGTMLILFVLNRMKVKIWFLTFWWGYYVVVYVTLRDSRHCNRILAFVIVWKRRQRLYLICLQHFLHKPVGFDASLFLHWQIRR